MSGDDRQLQAITDALGPDASGAAAGAISRAYEWARASHLGQVRKDGSPLFDHVLGVTHNVLDAGSRDPEMVVAALLHDLVENTPVGLEEVRRRFGERVPTLVAAVTNRPDEDSAAAAQRALMTSRDALFLRLCDRLDGVRRSPGRKKESRRKFLAESRAVHLPLAEQHFPGLAQGLRAALEAAEAQ